MYVAISMISLIFPFITDWHALGAARSFYVVLAEIAEQIFMLWVGVLYYMSNFNSAINSATLSMVSGIGQFHLPQCDKSGR